MKKGVIIELDKPRTLRYGINALAKVEDSIGKPIVGLVTIVLVGVLVDDFSVLNIVAEKLGEALFVAFGKPKTESKEGE